MSPKTYARIGRWQYAFDVLRSKRSSSLADVVIQVSGTAKHDDAGRVEHVLRHVVDEARTCAGCVRYEWFLFPGDDRRFFVYGECESDDAFAQCQKSPVITIIGEQLLPLLDGRPSFKHFRTFGRRSWSRVDRRGRRRGDDLPKEPGGVGVVS